MPASAPQADPGTFGAAAPTSPEPPTADLVPYRPWLHRLAMTVVVAVFMLVAIGGNVTSLDAGLSVPHGWYTFGYFTPLAPLEVWWHDLATRWEHSHRLQGYVVGGLTIALVLWMWLTQRRRPWLPWFGTALLVLIIIQGIMGAKRVDLISTSLAVTHGITGQLILAFTVLIAAATSRLWLTTTQHARPSHAASPNPLPEGEGAEPTVQHAPSESNEAGEGITSNRASSFHSQPHSHHRSPHPSPLPEGEGAYAGCAGTAVGRGMRWLSLALLGLLLLQLVFGALVRHTHATVAIPDFPTAYGQWIPPLSQPELDIAVEAAFPGGNTFTVAQVALHFAHRLGAAAVLTAAIWLVVWLNLRVGPQRATKWPARWLMLLLGVQIALGASVVWSGEGHPEMATLHQAVGAALLAVATWLAIRVHLLDYASPHQEERTPADDAPQPTGSSPGRGAEVKEQPA